MIEGQRREASSRAFGPALLLCWGLAALVISTHLLGAGPLRDRLWGAHVYAFFPSWVLWVATGALVALLLALSLRPDQAEPVRSSRSADRRFEWLPWAAGLASLPVLWWLRVRHTFLGDGNPLVTNLPLGERTHDHQPLTLFLHHQGYELAARLGWFQGTSVEVARDSVALGSVLAGALFIPLAWHLAREMALSRDGDRPAAPSPWLLAGVLLSQGSVLLFFGYVENYTYYALALGGFAWAALRHLNGRSPLLLAIAAFLLALALNVSAIALAPAIALLAYWGSRDGARRVATLRDLGIGAALGVLISMALQALGNPSLVASIGDVIELSRRGQGVVGRTEYLFSAQHLNDVLNEHLLIGPAATLLFIGAIAGAVRGRGAERPLVLLVVAGLPALIASWSSGDQRLGYARDWDLFAPHGVILASAGALWLSGAARPVAHRALLAIVLISVYHTAPWIVLNRSLDGSLARLETLPLGRGRTENLVGSWYMGQQDFASAKMWFVRGTQTNPGNNLAWFNLGRIALDEGKPDSAVPYLRRAVALRPDRDSYRLRLVDGLVLDRRLPEAREEIDRLLGRDSTRAGYWAAHGVVLLGLGDGHGAQRSLERSIALEPRRPLWRKVRQRMNEPGAFERILSEDWVEIVVP